MISTFQLSNPQRGFSFRQDGPLDMRMDRETMIAAHDLLNNLSESELEGIFKKFGEERYSRRIARCIVQARAREPISTSNQLKEIVVGAVGISGRKYRIHPATRVFQALRIAVNDELSNLEKVLPQAVAVLKPGGRLAIISFHSLEDRIVKNFYRSQSLIDLKILTKKPIGPTLEETKINPRSRSAKLRAVEKLSTTL